MDKNNMKEDFISMEEDETNTDGGAVYFKESFLIRAYKWTAENF